jgi:transcriptional regulator with XRE-family HTH domain
MNANQLRNYIEKHELLQRDLAVLAGVTDRQVRAWLCGRNRVPIAVCTLLQAIEDGKLSIGYVAKTNQSFYE